ncbi:hypothetical protein SacazDRAFT_00717 [Saccharomonospora azurea NA-128]|uniref:Uncharacterized protein n=1 Tax=Saccharomonospora azurea NA-128 TaxID=882081 RepID=H8GBE3_9PSEU|nr:hypothetical protein SacazDRAFT_00717 [Saccharomonospora azurea NA-128]
MAYSVPFLPAAECWVARPGRASWVTDDSRWLYNDLYPWGWGEHAYMKCEHACAGRGHGCVGGMSESVCALPR